MTPRFIYRRHPITGITHLSLIGDSSYLLCGVPLWTFEAGDETTTGMLSGCPKCMAKSIEIRRDDAAAQGVQRTPGEE